MALPTEFGDYSSSGKNTRDPSTLTKLADNVYTDGTYVYKTANNKDGSLRIRDTYSYTDYQNQKLPGSENIENARMELGLDAPELAYYTPPVAKEWVPQETSRTTIEPPVSDPVTVDPAAFVSPFPANIEEIMAADAASEEAIQEERRSRDRSAAIQNLNYADLMKRTYGDDQQNMEGNRFNWQDRRTYEFPKNPYRDDFRYLATVNPFQEQPIQTNAPARRQSFGSRWGIERYATGNPYQTDASVAPQQYPAQAVQPTRDPFAISAAHNMDSSQNPYAMQNPIQQALPQQQQATQQPTRDPFAMGYQQNGGSYAQGTGQQYSPGYQPVNPSRRVRGVNLQPMQQRGPQFEMQNQLGYF